MTSSKKLKGFKFGQLLNKEDICNRSYEITMLKKICRSEGRAVVYGARRYGKTSVVRNVVMKDFLDQTKKSFAIYVDLIKLKSKQDFILRLKVAIEESLAKRAKIKSFLSMMQAYLKNIRLDFSFDPQTGIPQVSLKSDFKEDIKNISQLFSIIKSLSQSAPTMLIFDEFQDIVKVDGLDSQLRELIQKLNQMPVIFLGSRQHVLKDLFQNENKPFYGVGTDIEFKEIPRHEWLPYIQSRFSLNHQIIKADAVDVICNLMSDVPNSIQEFCHWIWMSEQSGKIVVKDLYMHLNDLIENKSSRFYEVLAPLSKREINILIGISVSEPVLSFQNISFLSRVQMSASGAKAAIERLSENGKLTESQQGYKLTDPLLRHFILKKFKSVDV